MKGQFLKIDKEAEFVNDGYNKFVQNIEIENVSKDFDGLLSLCIDSRLAVSQICEQFPTKEPISTAGNALPLAIKSLSNYTYENALVTHGVHPDLNPSHQPACGGHIIALKGDSENIYTRLVQNLQPYVKRTFTDYDPFITANNLGKIWHSIDTRFYDHTTGMLYDMKGHKKDLGVDPRDNHTGMPPSIGQDPPLIVINTLGKPFFRISKGHRAREIGGVVEIFYPETQLPETIIESLVFCLQQHYINKNISITDFKSPEEGQFRDSDTLVFLADSESGIKSITKSLLSVKNQNHKKFIEGYFKDPKDIIIGIVPEVDNKFIEITAK